MPERAAPRSDRSMCPGMMAGKLLHVIVDQHIYNRHIPLVKELIERPQYPAPKVWLDPEVTDFYEGQPPRRRLYRRRTDEVRGGHLRTETASQKGAVFYVRVRILWNRKLNQHGKCGEEGVYGKDK